MKTISSSSFSWYSSSPSSSQSVELIKIKMPGRLCEQRKPDWAEEREDDAHCLALRKQLWTRLVHQKKLS